MDARLGTKRDVAGQTVGVRFAEESGHLRVALTPFIAKTTTIATVSPRALVRCEAAA